MSGMLWLRGQAAHGTCWVRADQVVAVFAGPPTKSGFTVYATVASADPLTKAALRVADGVASAELANWIAGRCVAFLTLHHDAAGELTFNGTDVEFTEAPQ
ncbi:hypothetical protein [Nocardia sp. NPDC052566]|uniref:hypothetical protein n=1 Tax=Nocardia sp. NPDC052566 TaxID=3364330 RepID=UPI0037C8A6B8